MNDQIDILFDKAINIMPLEELVELPNDRLNTPQWHQCEHAMWRIGEQIRQIQLVNKKVVLSNQQIEKIISIINNRFAKRGRQTFVWLLAKRQYAYLASRIIEQIYDDSVSLHIFDMIYKMRALGYEKEVLDFQERFRPLVSDRKKIQKYLKSFS